MRYLSLFSGIEACTVAWEPLGWEAVAFAEYEDFPKAVLAHRFPNVPDLGDVTKITEEHLKPLGKIDVVVGGTPCQNLSMAGNRKGLKGEASSLFFEFVRIFELARKHNEARYLLWENVPGAFSTHGGHDFRVVLELLAGGSFPVPEDGWKNSGVALGPNGLTEWRVLDAQYFGVPQRRRRIFALLDTGAWWSRQPFLFEQEGMSGHIAQSGDEREGTAEGIKGGVGESCAVIYENHGCDSRITRCDEVAPTLGARMGTGGNNVPLVMSSGQANAEINKICPTLNCLHEAPILVHCGQYEDMQDGRKGNGFCSEYQR